MVIGGFSSIEHRRELSEDYRKEVNVKQSTPDSGHQVLGQLWLDLHRILNIYTLPVFSVALKFSSSPSSPRKGIRTKRPVKLSFALMIFLQLIPNAGSILFVVFQLEIARILLGITCESMEGEQRVN